jgi:hypothetical protein
MYNINRQTNYEKERQFKLCSFNNCSMVIDVTHS